MTYEMEEPIANDSGKKSNGSYISMKWLLLLLAVSVVLPVGDAQSNSTDCPPMPAVPVEEPVVTDPFYGRLSGEIQPNHYTVWLKIYLDLADGAQRYSFDGNVSIDMHVYQTTSTIKVHARDMTIYYTNTYLTDNLQNTIAITNQTQDSLYEFYVIETATPLEAGKDYTLHVNFDAPITTDFHGLYRSFYGEPPNTVDLVASQCEAVAARTIFPCFDEPSFKATFDMTIVHRDRRHALFNSPSISQKYVEGDWLETVFERTVVMPTYLIAVVVSDFPYLEIEDAGLTFRVWAQPDLIASANYSLQVGIQMLRFLEDVYQIPYPMSKMDMVAVPQFLAGAMENWGLVLYSEGAMLYDPDLHTPGRKQAVATTVAHELVHMWFGNLVSPDWWDHLWLNEGFATFDTYQAVDHVEPDWKIWETFHVADMQSAYTADSRSSSARPLIHPVGWNQDINRMFDTITYSKGGAICRHFRSFLDDPVIRSGLISYLTTHQYDTAVSDDLWAALTAADVGSDNTDVKVAMDSFTLMAGHPIVTVNRTGTTTVVASQTYFMLDPNDYYQDQFPNNGYVWNVPLTYTDSANPDFVFPYEEWLYKDPSTITLTGVTDQDWVLFNVDKWGFYRVNYDDDNWQKLADQFNANHTMISDQSRASTIDDAFKVSQPFHTDNVNALRLTEYLDKEFSYMIWETVLDNLGYTHNMLLRKSEFYLFEQYWSKQVQPLYESLGWDFSQGGHLDYFQRVNAIETACTYGTADCVTQALAQYRDWMATGVNNIREEMKATVYCTSIRHGGLDEWEFAHAQATNGSSEADRLESAMGCTQDYWLLQRYLEDENFVASTVIANILDKSGVGFSVAWDYTMNNFNTRGVTYGTVWAFQDYMNTQYDVDQLNMFGSRYHDMSSTAASEFYDAVQRVETNRDWMARNRDSMKAWLLQVTPTQTANADTEGAKANVPKPNVSSNQLRDPDSLIVDGKFNGRRAPRVAEGMYRLQNQHL